MLHAAGDRRFLYFQKFLNAEQDFQRELTQRLQTKWRPSDVTWPTIAADVLRNQPLTLDVDQQRALSTAA